MNRSVLVGGFVACALVAAALAGRSGGQSTDAVSASAVEMLREELRAESAGRTRLAEEVSRLRAEVAALQAGRAAVAGREEASGAAAASVASAGPAASGAAGQVAAVEAPRDGVHGVAGRVSFDEAALVRGGFRPDEATRLRELAESVEMDRLYLRDRATREGWVSTPRFAEEFRAVGERTERLRSELGDDGFDWFLYASGRLNRVLVSDVLDRSPAASAGLESGDVVLRYAGARVFDANELARATSEGRVGETVAIEISRGSERRTVYVPRGPLGVRLGTDRGLPDTRP